MIGGRQVKLHTEIRIDAPIHSVWDAVVTAERFNEWTALFHEGSYFVGGWKQGDAIRFVTMGSDGKETGILSKILISDYPNHIVINHLGMIVDGIEDYTSEQAKEWTPGYEEYTLVEADDDKTLFIVDVDTPEAYFEDFKEDWRKALLKLKEICER